MRFRELFPATASLLRLLASGPARVVYILTASIVIIPAFTLRMDSALFERRVLAVVHALSDFKFCGITTIVGTLWFTSRTSAVAVFGIRVSIDLPLLQAATNPNTTANTAVQITE
jgi:hypothetical protein